MKLENELRWNFKLKDLPSTLVNMQAAWQLRALACIDLTTLAGDDTPVNVTRLCVKAAHPISKDIVKMLNMNEKGISTTFNFNVCQAILTQCIP